VPSRWSTAAIRGAGNREDVVDALHRIAGVEVVVLSGDEEARLAFVGAPAQAAYGGLRLPFPPGRAYVITQTPGAFQNCAVTGGSHCIGNDVWAYDFGLHIGDQIAAAHSGTVIRYVAGFGNGSCNPAFRNDANYIVLDHGDGYSSIYWHISYGSASVAPGQFVAQGHPIADAGAAGIVCGNPGDHLHFAVEPTPLDGQSATRSVQIHFDEAGEPALGTAPVSANRPRYSATYVGGSEWVVLGNAEHHATTGLWRNTGRGLVAKRLRAVASRFRLVSYEQAYGDIVEQHGTRTRALSREGVLV